VLGTAAAVRLLPRRGLARRTAIVALVAVTVLLVMTGPYALWTLLIAAAALGYQRFRSNASLRVGRDRENPQSVPALSLARRYPGAE
jgi:amino acid efflux transporter